MQKFIAKPVPHNDDDIFVAIIITEDGKTLIAQCTSLVLARHLVDCHNDRLARKVKEPEVEE
jgi:hypothetical protein